MNQLSNSEIANEIGAWILGQWDIASRNCLRMAVGLPVEALNTSTSLFTKIKEQLDAKDEAHAKQLSQAVGALEKITTYGRPHNKDWDCISVAKEALKSFRVK